MMNPPLIPWLHYACKFEACIANMQVANEVLMQDLLQNDMQYKIHGMNESLARQWSKYVEQLNS